MNYVETMNWIDSKLNGLDLKNKHGEKYEGLMALIRMDEIIGDRWIELNELFFIKKEISEEQFKLEIENLLENFKRNLFRKQIEKSIVNIQKQKAQ